jgi:hypothetical protein
LVDRLSTRTYTINTETKEPTMTTDTQVFFFMILGLILTMLGVGGVENSVTDTELLQSLAVSALGLLLMWVSTLMLRAQGYR